jgi:hypothetical protein|nr:MAG TPA: protein of unknown function (DUF771) [Caudoviricetes sp.]
MEDLINRKSLQDLIKSTFLEMRPKLEDELTGRTIKLDEFRKKYCGGKSPEWVRTFIFDKFRNEIDYENGGWCINPRQNANGRYAIIFEDTAAKWMKENRHRINWYAKLKN